MGNSNCCFYRRKDYKLFTDAVYDPLDDDDVVYDKMLGQDEVVISFRSNPSQSHSPTDHKYNNVWNYFDTFLRKRKVTKLANLSDEQFYAL